MRGKPPTYRWSPNQPVQKRVLAEQSAAANMNIRNQPAAEARPKVASGKRFGRRPRVGPEHDRAL